MFMNNTPKTERKDTYVSPRWSAEFLDCSMPMTFDQYNLCSYRCQYCFSFYQRIHMKDYAENNAKFVNVEKVKDIFLHPDDSEFGEYVKKRIPMQWGGLSEPFDIYLEPKYGIGLELMKFFREIDYPVAFSTKSVWWLKDSRYTDIVRNAKNFHFKFSIITMDEEKRRIIEQGVPTTADRLWALGEVAKLNTAGVNLRLRPFMIGVSNPTHLQLIREAANRGAGALTTEFFCLESRADLRVKKRYAIMSHACGFDLWQFYKTNSRRMQGYLRLNYEIKRPFIEEMQALCKELGIGFFVSDAHHKEKCVLADKCAKKCPQADGNTMDDTQWGSCCGLPNDTYFSNHAKCQFTQAITLAKKNGEVRFNEIDKEFNEYLKGTKVNTVLHAGDMAQHYHKTMYDYMKYIWNHPTASQSPWRYFDKLMIPVRVDEDGMVVYKFNQEKYDNHTV